MRNIIMLFPLLALTAMQSNARQNGTPSAGIFKDAATPVEWRRELPRTHTVSYPTEQESVNASGEPSQYFQPLGGEWSVSEKDGGKTKIYKHNYKMPFGWIERQMFLYVGGATGAYDILINGEYAGYNQDGATAAEFDITSNSKEGLNTVEILVYSDYGAKKLTADGKRQPSLTGGVHVVSQPRVRIRDYTARFNFEGADATMELGVILKTHLLNTKNYRVFYRLLSPSGDEVAAGHRDSELDMKSEDTVRFFITIPKVKKWTHETPNLYTLLLKTQHGGRFGEYISYKVGMRTVGMENGKLFLNSIELPLSVTGFNTSGDRDVMIRELSEIKKAGYNAVMLDNPGNEPLYSACDETGIYVINQTDINTSAYGDSRAKNGNPSNDPQWEKAYVGRAMAMYYTSRSHPSAIGFSIAGKSANGYNLYESYLALKAAEHNRPVIYMDGGGEWNSDAVSGKPKAPDQATAGQRITLDVNAGNKVSSDVSPVMELTDPSRGLYRITNRAVVTQLQGEVVYVLKQGSRTVSEGRIPVVAGPGESIDVPLPLGSAKPGKTIKYDVRLVSNFK